MVKVLHSRFSMSYVEVQDPVTYFVKINLTLQVGDYMLVGYHLISLSIGKDLSKWQITDTVGSHWERQGAWL